jgi:hypothetical protein
MSARLSATALSSCLYKHHRMPCWLSTGRTARRSSHYRQERLRIRSQAADGAVEDAFESLAGLICPQDIPVALGVTDLGRGLVATQDVPAGQCLLSLDCFSTLLVVDEPLRTGDAFGASVLSEWQSLWMELPPLLANYLRSRECQLGSSVAAQACTARCFRAQLNTLCHCRCRELDFLAAVDQPNITQVPHFCLCRERGLVPAPGGMAAVAEAEQHEPSVGHVPAAAAKGTWHCHRRCVYRPTATAMAAQQHGQLNSHC